MFFLFVLGIGRVLVEVLKFGFGLFFLGIIFLYFILFFKLFLLCFIVIGFISFFEYFFFSLF